MFADTFYISLENISVSHEPLNYTMPTMPRIERQNSDKATHFYIYYTEAVYSSNTHQNDPTSSFKTSNEWIKNGDVIYLFSVLYAFILSLLGGDEGVFQPININLSYCTYVIIFIAYIAYNIISCIHASFKHRWNEVLSLISF